MVALFRVISIAFLTASIPLAPANSQNVQSLDRGRCFYSDAYATLLAQGVVFADCDSAFVDRSGNEVVFGFRHSRRERSMEFRTVPDGDKWRIKAVRLRSGNWRPTSGECAIYKRGGKVSTLTCYTTRGPLIYAANFEVGRGI